MIPCIRCRALAVCLAALSLVVTPQSGLAYLVLGYPLNGHQVLLTWSQTPVPYFVNDTGIAGVSSTDMRAAVGRAFASWQAVPTASISYTFVGFTSALPGEDDGMSTLGFVSRPDLDRVLAATDFLVDSVTGAVLESDIFFNSAFQWSVAPGGEPDHFDLESVALHEIGHLSGLSHSALGETELLDGGGRRVIATDAVMFPIAFPSGTVNRTLHDDDIAGISDLYPDAGVRSNTGSISGRVTKDGQGVYGAHLVAFNPVSGAMIGGFALDTQGRFVLGDLPPGFYVLRAEPLDDAGTDSFLDGEVDVDFHVAYVSKLVIVPRGADSGTIDVHVVKK
jgi:matrixin